MKITRAKNLKQIPDFNKLVFGHVFTDHMLEMDFENGKWGEPYISPYHTFELQPSALVFHYGQGIFEGCKAYKDTNGKVSIFRTKDNLVRMNKSAERICMPQIDVDMIFDAIKQLIILEQAWIPNLPGTSLYIRPTMIATEEIVGLRVSSKFKFFVILSPVGLYHQHEGSLTKIYVEDHLVRAAIGGTGEAKCLGNYGASFFGSSKVKQLGFDDVLWLDAKENKYIEEVGSMNIMFVIDDTVITPALNGSILHGITRDSVLKILKKYGYKYEERRISIDEIMECAKNKRLKEIFGVGTAAVISPVGTISHGKDTIVINNDQVGPTSAFLLDRLTGIQTGRYADEFGWRTTLN